MGNLGQVSTVASSSTAGTAAVAADLQRQHRTFDLYVAAVFPDDSVAMATTTGIDIVANGAVQRHCPSAVGMLGRVESASRGHSDATSDMPGDAYYIVVDRSGNIWASRRTAERTRLGSTSCLAAPRFYPTQLPSADLHARPVVAV